MDSRTLRHVLVLDLHGTHRHTNRFRVTRVPRVTSSIFCLAPEKLAIKNSSDAHCRLSNAFSVIRLQSYTEAVPCTTFSNLRMFVVRCRCLIVFLTTVPGLNRNLCLTLPTTELPLALSVPFSVRFRSFNELALVLPVGTLKQLRARFRVEWNIYLLESEPSGKNSIACSAPHTFETTEFGRVGRR